MLSIEDLIEAKRKIEGLEIKPLTPEEYIKMKQKNRENYEKLKGCAYIVVPKEEE